MAKRLVLVEWIDAQADADAWSSRAELNGGDHARSNVDLACMLCNSRKWAH